MRVEELESKSIDELGDIASEVGADCNGFTTKAEFVKLLSTYPDDVDILNEYVEDSSVGMIVAFRTDDMKVKSAKIVKKSSKDRKLLLETKYGVQYIVSYADIVWVNTTGRWPRWVYNLMKGIGDGKKSKAEA